MTLEKNKIITTIVLCLFIMGGFIAFFIGIQSIIESHASTNWPTVQGYILKSFVDTRSKKSAYGLKPSNPYFYRADITYIYSVNGTNYTSKSINYNGLKESRDLSQQQIIVDKYNNGKLVPVYYDPKNPAKSFLEPGLTFIVFGWLILGTLFIVVGGSFIIIL